jgi:HK97 family phage major capsid protein
MQSESRLSIIENEIQANQVQFDALMESVKAEGRNFNEIEDAKANELMAKIEAGNLKKEAITNEIHAKCADFVRKVEKLPARAKVRASSLFHSDEDAYNSGKWIQATLLGDPLAAQYCRGKGILNAMTTSVNPSGGFIVPEPLENTIIELREQYGVFRRHANVVGMSDGVMIVPKLAGEHTAYFVGENSTITTSDATLTQVRLEAKKLAAMTVVSSELSEDAVVSVAEMVARSVAQIFAVKEDECGFLGDGTSTYGGMTGLAGGLAAGSKVTATSRQTFSALTLGDFESVIGKAKLWAGSNPKWFISQAGWAASMQRLANAVGGVTASEVSGGIRKEFLGYEVVITQVLEDALTGTTTLPACYFGDLSQGAYLGSRRGVSVAVDSSRYFENDAIAIRATERFDINVHDRGDANNAGGIIQLVFG